MPKLNLSLDALVVETFVPSPREETLRGTVRANGLTEDCFTQYCATNYCETNLCDTVEYTCTGGGHPIPTNAPTCRAYTCPGMGETCYPAKTCINPE